MRNVLITGASRGIGAETARYFAKMGDKVIINYNNSEAEAKKLEKETHGIAIKADVSNSVEVKKMFEEIGRVDVLINNAGIAGFYMLDAMSDDEWNKMLATNLSSAFYCSRAVLPQMISRKSGAIINISSMWGLTGASCEVAYSAAKAGLIGMTKALANEWAQYGITVNAIGPGYCMTEMTKPLLSDEAVMAKYKEKIPMGRLGTPEDMATTTVYLAADASSYVTGQMIYVDGGWLVN